MALSCLLVCIADPELLRACRHVDAVRARTDATSTRSTVTVAATIVLIFLVIPSGLLYIFLSPGHAPFSANLELPRWVQFALSSSSPVETPDGQPFTDAAASYSSETLQINFNIRCGHDDAPGQPDAANTDRPVAPPATFVSIVHIPWEMTLLVACPNVGMIVFPPWSAISPRVEQTDALLAT